VPALACVPGLRIQLDDTRLLLLVWPAPILICFGRTDSAFGNFKCSRPFSKLASALSASTPTGIENVR
jgi:hypothetical protein